MCWFYCACEGRFILPAAERIFTALQHIVIDSAVHSACVQRNWSTVTFKNVLGSVFMCREDLNPGDHRVENKPSWILFMGNRSFSDVFYEVWVLCLQCSDTDVWWATQLDSTHGAKIKLSATVGKRGESQGFSLVRIPTARCTALVTTIIPQSYFMHILMWDLSHPPLHHCNKNKIWWNPRRRMTKERYMRQQQRKKGCIN